MSRIKNKIGEYGLSIQSPDGSMPPGCNGPHQHKMTTVRNTGHWSVLFSHLYLETKDARWEEAVRKSIDLIISGRYHPIKGAFLERQEPHRSSTNGLIGQTWTIEAIHYAGIALSEPSYLKVARDVIELHKFDKDRGLWHEIDLSGSPQQIGMTLNQQIWFMAQALTTNSENEMVENADIFLDNLESHSKIRNNGLFYTAIHFPVEGKLRKFKQIKRNIIHALKEDNRLEIDNGYQIFTLLGLTLLYKKLPNHPYFQNSKFIKALRYAFSESYHRDLKENRFGYPYNVPGFEIPVIWESFKEVLPSNSFDIAVASYNKQISEYLTFDEKVNIHQNYDTETLMARFYEITRISKDLINKMER